MGDTLTVTLIDEEGFSRKEGRYGTHVPGRRRLIWDITDSIDYAPSTNTVALRNAEMQRNEPRHPWGVTGSTIASLTTTIISGAFIGITALAMETGVSGAEIWRNGLLQRALDGGLSQAIAVHLGLAVSSVLIIAGLVQWIAPGAAGAGVSLVMAFLNGNDIAGLFTPGVFFLKLAGTITARMAALAVGPEAPMVHLGACISSTLFGLERRWLPAISKRSQDTMFTNASHREIVSAGTAAGLAAAFCAPVGGVLFALEEACSVWSRKTAWRCLLSTFAAALVISQLGAGPVLNLASVYPLSSEQWLKQTPCVIGVAVGGGLLGAAFNWLRRHMQRWRAARRRHAFRLLEAAVVAIITVAVIFGAATTTGRCLKVPDTWRDTAHTVRWTCAQGHYNDLATALLGPSSFVIKSFLALGSTSEPINNRSQRLQIGLSNSTKTDNNLCTASTPCYYSVTSLVATCVVHLVLMVLTSGLAVPGGMFLPSIAVGGSFGAAIAMMLTEVVPPFWDVQPGIYALVGATATLAAVFRSTISLVVILFEGTRRIEFLPGILAATIISNTIAHWVHPDGVYESELEADGRVFFLRPEPPGALRWRMADSLMATDLVQLHRIESVEAIVEFLQHTTHNGFPIVSLALDAPSGTPRHLEGFILRSQLLVLLQERAFCNKEGRYLWCRGTVADYEADLDALMHAAAACSDGLEGASEAGVDPLGPTQEAVDEVPEGISNSMLQTLETLEGLREVPALADVLGDGTPESTPRQETAEPTTPRGVTHLNDPRNGSEFYLNLSAFMDRGHVTVRPQTPATVVHRMFVSLSLRHLCVTDAQGNVLGIITRKDLDNAAGHGWWRANKIAPSPVREYDEPPPYSPSWLGESFAALVARLQAVRASSPVSARFSV